MNNSEKETSQKWFVIAATSMGVIAPIAGSLSDRFGTRVITFAGLVILLSGYLLMTSLSEKTSTLSFFQLFMPIGLGMRVFQSPNNSAIMGMAPPDKLGVVSGMLSLTRVLR